MFLEKPSASGFVRSGALARLDTRVAETPPKSDAPGPGSLGPATLGCGRELEPPTRFPLSRNRRFPMSPPRSPPTLLEPQKSAPSSHHRAPVAPSLARIPALRGRFHGKFGHIRGAWRIGPNSTEVAQVESAAGQTLPTLAHIARSVLLCSRLLGPIRESGWRAALSKEEEGLKGGRVGRGGVRMLSAGASGEQVSVSATSLAHGSWREAPALALLEVVVSWGCGISV